MEDFKVDIRFPRQEESDPNLIVIQGLEEDCYECKDHLLNLEEEYVSKRLIWNLIRDKVVGFGYKMSQTIDQNE